MAPRIKNITPDEFRRIFQAPEIRTPGFSVADAIALNQAIEARRSNDEKQKLRMAQIERRIAEEEAKAQQLQQQTQLGELLATPAQDPDQLIETAVGPVPESQIGAPTVGDATPTQSIQDIEQRIAEEERAQEITGLEARLDPLGTLQRVRGAQQAEIDFARDKELLGLKFANKMKELETKEERKIAKQKQKASGLVQRLAAQADNLSSMVDEFKSFNKLLTKEGFTGVKGVVKGKVAVPLDKVTGGAAQLLAKNTFLGDFLKVDPNISTQDELADSLARRIYKTISGDVGNIAFSEGQFAKAFVPVAGETGTRRTAKIDRLDRFITRMKSGADALRAKFDAGQISEEELSLELGNIANEAFTQEAAALGLTAQELSEEQAQPTGDLSQGFTTTSGIKVTFE